MWFAVSFFHLVSSLLLVFIFGIVTGYDVANVVYLIIATISITLSVSSLILSKLKGGKKDE